MLQSSFILASPCRCSYGFVTPFCSTARGEAIRTSAWKATSILPTFTMRSSPSQHTLAVIRRIRWYTSTTVFTRIWVAHISWQTKQITRIWNKRYSLHDGIRENDFDHYLLIYLFYIFYKSQDYIVKRAQ